MSPATTRLQMLLMRISELPIWTQEMYISRRDYNCFETDSRPGCPTNMLLLYHKMFIHSSIRLLVSELHRVINGVYLPHSLGPLVLLLAPVLARQQLYPNGAEDWQPWITYRNHSIITTNTMSFDHRHSLVSQVLAKSKCANIRNLTATLQ